MNHTKLHDENHNRTSRQRKHILHLVYSSDNTYHRIKVKFGHASP
jgi:hypothetical protein